MLETFFICEYAGHNAFLHVCCNLLDGCCNDAGDMVLNVLIWQVCQVVLVHTFFEMTPRDKSGGDRSGDLGNCNSQEMMCSPKNSCDISIA